MQRVQRVQRAPQSKTILWLSLLMLGVAVLYGASLDIHFASDDFRYLELASQADSVADLAPYLTGGCTRIGWPIVLFVFWLMRAIGLDQPAGYRLFAIAVHLLNILSVFLLARRLSLSRRGAVALVAALIVALHPRQVESVLWLAALTWPMATLFSVLMTHCYVSWQDERRRRWLVATMVCGAAAALSSPGSVVMLAILPALDVLRVRRRLSSVAAWALIGAAVSVPALMCGVGGMLDAPVSGYGLSVKEGLQQAPLYAALVWWPVFQHLKDVLAASPLQFVAIMAATGTLVLGSIWLALRRGAALARLGLVWTIVGCLAPSFFHPVLWDRYMSLMLVGVALLVAGVAETLPARWTRLGLVVLALWIVLSVPQITLKIEHWRQAGQITATVLAETAARYPRPAPHASFFFIGLPDARNGCHVWSCCIASALRWQYGDPTLRARRDIDHGVLSAPASGDLILDFSARGWMPGR